MRKKLHHPLLLQLCPRYVTARTVVFMWWQMRAIVVSLDNASIPKRVLVLLRTG